MEKKKTYSYEEAFEASLRYFRGDELAARVWVNKYAMKDSFGKIYEKDPDDMHWRIANEIARVEKKYKNPLSAEEIFKLLAFKRRYSLLIVYLPKIIPFNSKNRFKINVFQTI